MLVRCVRQPEIVFAHFPSPFLSLVSPARREGNADSASTAVVEEAQDHADPLVEDGSSGGGAPLGEGEEEGEERGEGRVIDIAGNR